MDENEKFINSGRFAGRLPVRIGVYGRHSRQPCQRLFFPSHTTGLPKNEITIAEALKQAYYATGMVGKWHLGMST